MKSRLVVLTMLVLGMLLSTTGAGLAVSGLVWRQRQHLAVLADPPGGGGGVLGDQDSGGGDGAPADNGGGRSAPRSNDVQPSRQVEAGANNTSSRSPASRPSRSSSAASRC